jgi:Cu-Zn family superoxide dismutase
MTKHRILYGKNLLLDVIVMNAVATFNGLIQGSITFSQSNDGIVNIKGTLTGFKNLLCGRINSLHGFHIHEYGDLRDNCKKACAHFNPLNHHHGGLNDKNSHAGDLGNIVVNESGSAIINLQTSKISLTDPKLSIIGRSLMIHEDPDDVGLGNHDDSLTTGHAGKRIACAVIGLTNNAS